MNRGNCRKTTPIPSVEYLVVSNIDNKILAVYVTKASAVKSAKEFNELEENIARVETRGVGIMSCFVCRAEIFKSVAKVCFQYGIRQISRGDFPLTIGDLDEFAKKLAELNCKNYAIRYNEQEVEAEVEGFTEVPLLGIWKQEIADCLCWLYQTEDYCSNDPLFKMVVEATEWAKLSNEWKDTDLTNCRWG